VGDLCTPKRILEVGCGDGAFAQRMTGLYPFAEYTGIDVAATAGRLYQGDRDHVVFPTMYLSDLIAEAPAPFDLVVIVDVIHPIPSQLRPDVLRGAAALTAPDGMLLIKEWERRRGLAHFVAHAVDRYLSGDKDIEFLTSDELRSLLTSVLPEFEVQTVGRIRPRHNNILYALGRP